MVAPLVESLLRRALRGRARASASAHPVRLVGEPHSVDSVGFVADRTSVLLHRPDGEVVVLEAGSLVLPSLRGGTGPTAVVLSHEPVDVWLRLGPFETLDARAVQQIELSLTLALSEAPAVLRELADQVSAGHARTVLDRLAHEVADRTTEAIRRRTLADLTSLSLLVLLERVLPETFLGGLLERSRLEVVDVDWPTEGGGRLAALPWASRRSDSRSDGGSDGGSTDVTVRSSGDAGARRR